MLLEKRDMVAAQAFLKDAMPPRAAYPFGLAVAQKPSNQRVTTDRQTALPRAITEVLGAQVEHALSDCLTNRRLARPPSYQTALGGVINLLIQL